MNAETKICQNCHREFWVEPEDFLFYEKISVPAPTFCPECRMRRRFAFRNERFVYKRKSDFSGKEIFAMFPPDSFQKVYENEVWFSDKWDPMRYGRDVDFSRPFLEQLRELWKEVPTFALSVIYGVNSDYSNNYTGFKNCYLVFNGNYAEDCLYGNGANHTKNCVDFSHVDKSEFCYETTFSVGCSRCFFSTRLNGCYDMWFSKKCSGCYSCFGCVNLRNKSYCIFNEQYSKEAYEQKLTEFRFSSRENLNRLRREVRAFWLEYPNKYAENNKNVNSTGSYVYNSKNVQNSYLVQGAEDSRYCQYVLVPPTKECYDYTVWGHNAELVYEAVASGLGLYNAKFCWECWPENNRIEYSLYCANSSNLFGCVGVKKKEYCILNKQYAKTEYESLRKRIVDHMDKMPYISEIRNLTPSGVEVPKSDPSINSGSSRAKSRDEIRRIVYRYGEFFPPEFSPYPYNHTLAQEQFSIDKAEASRNGFFWKESETKNYEPTMTWRDLPDTIDAASDDILRQIILCEAWEAGEAEALKHNCTKAFRVTSQEFEFYRRFKLPLPRKCYNTRHHERIQERLPVHLYHRGCQCAGELSENGLYRNAVVHVHGNGKCLNEFETSYAPDRPEIVYCEQCYNSEAA